MKTGRRLPALICTARCPTCDLPTQLTIFESGPGGDFATLIGEKTGTLYRIDLGQIHYLHKSWHDLVNPAAIVEGGNGMIRRIPESVYCPLCKSDFEAKEMHIDQQVVVEAVEL